MSKCTGLKQQSINLSKGSIFNQNISSTLISSAKFQLNQCKNTHSSPLHLPYSPTLPCVPIYPSHPIKPSRGRTRLASTFLLVNLVEEKLHLVSHDGLTSTRPLAELQVMLLLLVLVVRQGRFPLSFRLQGFLFANSI